MESLLPKNQFNLIIFQAAFSFINCQIEIFILTVNTTFKIAKFFHILIADSWIPLSRSLYFVELQCTSYTKVLFTGLFAFPWELSSQKINRSKTSYIKGTGLPEGIDIQHWQ